MHQSTAGPGGTIAILAPKSQSYQCTRTSSTAVDAITRREDCEAKELQSAGEQLEEQEKSRGFFMSWRWWW
jgi:hypothetical protein